MNCPFCGKAVWLEDVRCPYCRNVIPRSEASAATEHADASRLPRQSKELEELLRYTPAAAGTGVGLIILTVFGLVFTSFAIFFIVTSKAGGAPFFFRLFPLIFVLVGVGMTAAGLAGLMKLTGSPLERLPAVVVGKRQNYSSNREGSGTTSYYLTIETEDGQRKEHSVRGSLYGQVERGDAGVAYIKGGYLLDFRRVRVREV